MRSREERLSTSPLSTLESYRARAQKRQSMTRLVLTGLSMVAGSLFALLVYGAFWLLSAGAELATGQWRAQVAASSFSSPN